MLAAWLTERIACMPISDGSRATAKSPSETEPRRVFLCSTFEDPRRSPLYVQVRPKNGMGTLLQGMANC